MKHPKLSTVRLAGLALLVALTVSVSDVARAADNPDLAGWRTRAQGITIVRDDWGVPHIYGRTDADVVFGLMYAQAEDDFYRLETNYLRSLGRLAEADGEKEIWRDLRMKLFIDPEALKVLYRQSPDSLRALMDAWAGGLNFYLATHPDVKPRVIAKFEPWMALSFSEGSIGGDIETVSLEQLEAFYGKGSARQVAGNGLQYPTQRTGSNGFAIAPANSASGHALLWINPHTSFYFREEAQLVSEEGLNAYGALTWGQFFVYQGFNDRAGWMHTSSNVDNIDEFLETVTVKKEGVTYRYGGAERPMITRKVVVPYKTATGMAQREFTIYRTHHGPIVRAVDGRWVSVALMEEPMKALIQSFTRTKARSMKEFRDIMQLHTNSSNDTVFADADGNIAYFHSNFVPRRKASLDWTQPVDGSDPSNDWQGVHSTEESPDSINPKGGWLQNTNNWPYSAAGPDSPKASAYPSYYDREGENPRGIHAIRVLQGKKGFTLETLRDAAFDPAQPELEAVLPKLALAWDQLAATSTLKKKLEAPVGLLRDWDCRWAADSIPNSIAIYWADEMWRMSGAERRGEAHGYDFLRNRATAAQRLDALSKAIDRLAADFGRWNVPWGEINRFQRLTANVVQQYDDNAPSTPVPFTTSGWGSLAAFEAKPAPNTKKWYGSSGNSFVAAVEFGPRVRAKAVTAGGLNSVKGSKHFEDQTGRYVAGNLRDVYFYREDLKGHIEREYHPGETR